MHRLTKGAALLAVSSLAAGGSFGIANAAPAAAAPAAVSEIIVTGSRIRTSPLDQDQPVISPRPASPRPSTCCRGSPRPAAD
jgi:iron complex outermembrane receptor protein